MSVRQAASMANFAAGSPSVLQLAASCAAKAATLSCDSVESSVLGTSRPSWYELHFEPGVLVDALYASTGLQFRLQLCLPSLGTAQPAQLSCWLISLLS
jgi:hypothetical protein